MPRILVACLLLLTLVWSIWPTGDSRPRLTGAVDAAPQVVAGSGSPDSHVVSRIDVLVQEQLTVLRSTIPLDEVHRFFVFVHASRSALPEAIAANLHEDSPAFALLGRHQVHLVWGEMFRLGSSPRAVVTHELVHELLDQLVRPKGGSLPRWFHEGLAQFLAGDTYLGAREEDLVWRAASGRLPAFAELAEKFPTARDEVQVAYAQSFSYVSWLVREFGLQRVIRVARNVDDLTSFERALVGVTQRSTLQLQDAWFDYLLHTSGAPWRVFLEQWWGLLAVALLPVLVMALRRRLAAGERASARLEEMELQAEREAEIAAQEAASAAQDGEPPHENETDDRTAGRGW